MINIKIHQEFKRQCITPGYVNFRPVSLDGFYLQGVGMENTPEILTAKQAWKKKMRQNSAKALKEINKSFCKPKKDNGLFINVLIILILLMIAGCFISRPVHAFTDEQAIRTLIGEASNQGMIGMVCVAEVLRHKGSLKGFYGYKSKHVDHEPAYVWKMARKAWELSKSTNYTKGADHFENIKAFGCPSWVKNCIETFRHKDHVFYKEVV